MKAFEEMEVKMTEVNEATRGDGPQSTSYLDWRSASSEHGRMEELR